MKLSSSSSSSDAMSVSKPPIPTLKNPIKIFARLKPTDGDPTPYEIEQIEKDSTTDEILVMKDYSPQHTHNRSDIHRFRYSKIFDRSANQEQVFERLCRPVLESAISGYNGTIFAYGQTGSGKTFTMIGSKEVFDGRGIIPRSLSYVFRKFQENEDGTQLQGVSISFLEIYNENGFDLLNAGLISGKLDDLGKVVLLEDGNQQIHLRNLSVHPVSSEDEALHLFYLGEHNRTIAETPMNDASTRSHCIFTIHMNIREASGSVVLRSKVHLVDLAGSERISNSNISGQLLNEARHINLALHYLEQVIVALGEANRSHIPYRNSMMTSILRDSLGGNCMTSMIANLSVEPRNMLETLSTCRFSQRVALVRNSATLNEEIDPSMLISQLKAEIKRLQFTITNSTITPLPDNAAPLNAEEMNECWKIISTYIKNPDENALLAIAPDMRVVQTCFRCLKMACNMSQSKSTMQMIKYALPESDSFPKNERIAELLQVLAHRDAEIKVLSKQLRKEKDANQKRNFKKLSLADLPSGERSRATSASSSNSYINEDNSGDLNHLNCTANSLQNPPYSSPGSPKSIIDKESLLLESLSETQKAALDSFMNEYIGKAMFQEARNSLVRKQAEVENLEEDMNRSQKNMNQLNKLMVTAAEHSDPNGNSVVLSEAFSSQKRTLTMQEERYEKSRVELHTFEEELKGHYIRLIPAFEDWWNNNTELHNADYSSIKLKDVATGVFKRSEVETMSKSPSSSKNPILRSLNVESKAKQKKRGHLNSNSTQRTEGSSTKEVQSPNKCNSIHPSSESNSSFSTVTKNSDSPNKYTNNFGLTSSDTIQLTGKNAPKAPPATPSFHPDPDELKLKQFDYHHSEDDQEIIKKLPMTGDPDTDAEIRSFFLRRQFVFREINEDKIILANNLALKNQPKEQIDSLICSSTKEAQSPNKSKSIHPSSESNSSFPTVTKNSDSPNNNTNNLALRSTDTIQLPSKKPPKTPPATPTCHLDPDELKLKQFDYHDSEDDQEMIKKLPMTGDPATDAEIRSFFIKRQFVFRKINEDKLILANNLALKNQSKEQIQ